MAIRTGIALTFMLCAALAGCAEQRDGGLSADEERRLDADAEQLDAAQPRPMSATRDPGGETANVTQP